MPQLAHLQPKLLAWEREKHIVPLSKVARYAKYDVVKLRDGMLELAALSDFFIASESFARALVGEDNPRKACRRIAELGPSLAGVTLGERGYVALEGDRWIERPAHPAAAVDPPQVTVSSSSPG